MHTSWLCTNLLCLSVCLSVCVCVCVSPVEDEEGTIEEQEAMEVEAEQKAEVEELNKEGQWRCLVMLCTDAYIRAQPWF